MRHTRRRVALVREVMAPSFAVCMCVKFYVNVCNRSIKFWKEIIYVQTFAVQWCSSGFFSFLSLTFSFNVKLLVLYLICEYLVISDRHGHQLLLHIKCEVMYWPLDNFTIYIERFTFGVGPSPRSQSRSFLLRISQMVSAGAHWEFYHQIRTKYNH